MRLILQPNYESASKWAANYLANRITLHQKNEKRPFVLGLPTGSTPLGLYHELIEFYQSGTLSFRNIITFNMDEYVV